MQLSCISFAVTRADERKNNNYIAVKQFHVLEISRGISEARGSCRVLTFPQCWAESTVKLLLWKLDLLQGQHKKSVRDQAKGCLWLTARRAQDCPLIFCPTDWCLHPFLMLWFMCVFLCVSVSGLTCSSDDTYLNNINNWHPIKKCTLSNEVRPGKAQHQFIFIRCAFPPCLICVLKEPDPTGNSTASPHQPCFVCSMSLKLILKATGSCQLHFESKDLISACSCPIKNPPNI